MSPASRASLAAATAAVIMMAALPDAARAHALTRPHHHMHTAAQAGAGPEAGPGNATSVGCSNSPPPGSKYTCQQQKSWGKCGEPWMKGYCCSVCGGGGGGGGGGGSGIPAHATHYSWPSGGNSCGSSTGNCIAISDGFTALWSWALRVPSKCESVPIYRGSCSSCGYHHAPSCPYGELCHANGGHLCVKCTDSSSVCKHNNWLRVQIADACPSDHPCNTCKGSENPCAQGRPHVDLCDGAFYNIAHYQTGWQGINVQVSTDLSYC